MYALVDANSFYASCEQVFRPDLKEKAVVVLSNNDGCIVARSKEAKALGIDMQKPYFQIKEILERHHVVIFSSNYTLYHDMSERVISVLRTFAEQMEVYSIDESFLFWRDNSGDWESLGRKIKDTVLRWTGLSVGVGIAPTKTLAKLANHLSKRAKGATGVHLLGDRESVTAAMAAVELEDIWGVSRGTIRRLKIMGITKPIQLRDASPHRIREHLGVVGERMIYELRGEPCIPLEIERPNKQHICCSRSFGGVTNDSIMLREAVSTFASQAAIKMRRQDLSTSVVKVFVATDCHADVEQYAPCAVIPLPTATNDSRLISKIAILALAKIYRPQHRYKKAGVMLGDLTPRTTVHPLLFPEIGDSPKTHRLMKCMDEINEMGRGTIRLASASPTLLGAGRTWHMRSDRRSPRYTTRWDELPTAIARL